MKVSSRIRSGVTVVSVHGRVLRHRTDAFAAWMAAETHDRWSESVLLDARAMTYINSAGMRTILRLFKRIGRNGGRFAVCGLADGIDRAFEVLGFDQIMDIHDSLEEALEKLSEPPETADRPTGIGHRLRLSALFHLSGKIGY